MGMPFRKSLPLLKAVKPMSTAYVQQAGKI